jgi:hypothetical protein
MEFKSAVRANLGEKFRIYEIAKQKSSELVWGCSDTQGGDDQWKSFSRERVMNFRTRMRPGGALTYLPVDYRSGTGERLLV